MGMNVQDMAKRLKVNQSTVSAWESGQKKPTLVQAERLAHVLKRPLAVLFLPEPPKTLPLPKDYRTVPMDERNPFSSETFLAVRRARRLQSLAIDLARELGREIGPQVGMARPSEDAEEAAAKARQQLGIEVQRQFAWRNANEALKEWRKALEQGRVLVFQQAMPLKETRGFSLTDAEIPVIVLNARDSLNGRIFSLFHEYAHLLLDDSGICGGEETDNFPGHVGVIERFCNHFSGALLVPKAPLLDHELVRSTRGIVPWSESSLTELAASFKVSREVILRRLVLFGRASAAFYKRKREEWKAQTEKRQEQRRTGGISPAMRCIRDSGTPFAALVLEAHRQGTITYSDVADYLAIRVKHLPQIEQLIRDTS
jgi:Zn-dependent peptidase ImmA (M78 family)/DNA-binding XRE family transcriptional regulator